ncbi:MAG: hypothetical protein ISS19_11350 [Bacteroidales bacterium]|nr:hypothetical protein [Bacteroidales bacterium]
MPLASSVTIPPQPEAIPADWLAEVDADHATDMQENRVITFTVTAGDGTTQKVYTVTFRYISSDASLSALSAALFSYFNSIPLDLI